MAKRARVTHAAREVLCVHGCGALHTRTAQCRPPRPAACTHHMHSRRLQHAHTTCTLAGFSMHTPHALSQASACTHHMHSHRLHDARTFTARSLHMVTGHSMVSADVKTQKQGMCGRSRALQAHALSWSQSSCIILDRLSGAAAAFDSLSSELSCCLARH